MGRSEKRSQGVSGTINAFNFIRRIGFPPVADILSIFVTVSGLAAILSLPFFGLSLVSTMLVVLSALIVPTIVGETICSNVILRGDPVLNFRRLVGMETLAWLPTLVVLPAYSLVGFISGNRFLWIDGLLVSIAASSPVRFLTIFSMSSLGQARKLAGSVIVPSLTLLLLTI